VVSNALVKLLFIAGVKLAMDLLFSIKVEVEVLFCLEISRLNVLIGVFCMNLRLSN
jgi:hypothetical protein